MNTTIPTPEEVKQYFSRAKEVRCLNLDIIVNISSVIRFDYDEKTNSYTSNRGVICVWKDGEFAEITKKKCNPEDCRNCKPCQEARNKN